MKIVELRCPNCGAMVSRQTMKCQYCGVSLILAEDGSALLHRKRIACPKCGNSMAEGSWFCVVCGEIIAKDVKRLKELQRKIRFEQERVKKEMPEISDKIEPDEFIYWCYYYKGLLANKYFIVTDKKLIKYDNFGQYWEAPWSEVVTIGDPEFIRLGSGYRNQFVVRTFNETVTFEFGEDSCLKFNANAQRALNDYTLQKKDIMALIYSLKFKDEEQQKP